MKLGWKILLFHTELKDLTDLEHVFWIAISPICSRMYEKVWLSNYKKIAKTSFSISL